MACRVPIAPSSAIMRCRFQARPCACEYRRDASGKPPAVLFMHGGGWVIGNLDTHDAICRTLARKAEPRCTPSTIAWRPSIRFQHRWTIAPPRCAGWSIMPRAWTWMFRGWAWRATAPAATWPRSGEHSGSVAAGLHRAGAGAVLSRDRSAWRDGFVPTHRRRIPTDRQLDALVRDHYLRPGTSLDDARFPRFSPLLSPLLAPRPSNAALFLLSCGLDPLADEGVAYAARAIAAGARVEHHHLPAHAHGIITSAGRIDTGRVMLIRAAAFLRETLLHNS